MVAYDEQDSLIICTTITWGVLNLTNLYCWIHDSLQEGWLCYQSMAERLTVLFLSNKVFLWCKCEAGKSHLNNLARFSSELPRRQLGEVILGISVHDTWCTDVTTSCASLLHMNLPAAHETLFLTQCSLVRLAPTSGMSSSSLIGENASFRQLRLISHSTTQYVWNRCSMNERLETDFDRLDCVYERWYQVCHRNIIPLSVS